MVFLDFSEWLALDCCVEGVWILGRGVVSPNVNVCDVFNSGTCAISDDANSTVDVKTSQGGEVLLGN